MNPHLSVKMTSTLNSPSAEHSLLLAFRFGRAGKADEHPAIVDAQLAPIDRDSLYEAWWVEGDVEYSTCGPVRIAQSGDYAALIFEADERGVDDHRLFVRDAYRELLRALSTTRHPRLVKVWNYLGAINEGEGDEERYRQFSAGRAMAFSEAGLVDEHAPTGTGVGTMKNRGLTIIALCSARDFALAENPRQISAFDYPRQYGPKSPKFGRGGSVTTEDHCLRLISGTASIVGHESMHPDDTLAQLDETMRNLDSLCDAVSESSATSPRLVLDDCSVLRVYLRCPEDYAIVAEKLRDRLGPGADQIAFLHGDICRRELLLEIDGVRVQ
jgi:chorismate lyase/3-hydroxybenzoate synthase